MIVLDEIKMYLLYDRHTLNAWIRHFCTNDLFTKNIVEFEAEYGLLGGF